MVNINTQIIILLSNNQGQIANISIANSNASV